ncbi:hypothetical protein RFI_19961 [Reticulomyxa filosa]|uniref:Uncharacterized protein n=1 Tax=Reticulomyxa filosa TaxID=46433 RepID=X6MWA0_RETFI|nr:hypothetical protein RFI_19961 [Reticulomyxa filosa]|eukprot:ETO17360.1 hypothetical protein RFI_19961 [Reticulomyxa filosa]
MRDSNQLKKNGPRLGQLEGFFPKKEDLKEALTKKNRGKHKNKYTDTIKGIFFLKKKFIKMVSLFFKKKKKNNKDLKDDRALDDSEIINPYHNGERKLDDFAPKDKNNAKLDTNAVPLHQEIDQSFPIFSFFFLMLTFYPQLAKSHMHAHESKALHVMIELRRSSAVKRKKKASAKKRKTSVRKHADIVNPLPSTKMIKSSSLRIHFNFNIKLLSNLIILFLFAKKVEIKMQISSLFDQHICISSLALIIIKKRRVQIAREYTTNAFNFFFFFEPFDDCLRKQKKDQRFESP